MWTPEAPLCARLSKPRAVRRSPRPAEGQNRSLILSGLRGALQTPTSGDQSCTPKHRVDRQATFRTDRSMGFVVRKCFQCSGECQQFCERLDGAPQIDHPISNLKVALGGNWPKVKPFVMASASQFRAPPPPSLKSTAFNEEVRPQFPCEAHPLFALDQRSASTPGNCLPSSHSRKAPPAVET